VSSAASASSARLRTSTAAVATVAAVRVVRPRSRRLQSGVPSWRRSARGPRASGPCPASSAAMSAASARSTVCVPMASRGSPSLEGGRVGADDPAVLRQCDEPLGHGAEPFDLRMQPKHDAPVMARQEELMLDHACARAHQPEGVAMVATAVAGDVEHAEQLTGGVGDGGGRAGQEGIALEIVLGAVHDDRRAVGQRRADRVGAAPLLAPDRPGAQGHARGAVGEIEVAEGVQQHAVRVGERDHAAAVADLLAQEGHHRRRMRDQVAPQFEGAGELGGRRVRCARRASVRRESEPPAAVPAGLETRREQPVARRAAIQQLTACLAQLFGGHAHRGGGGARVGHP